MGTKDSDDKDSELAGLSDEERASLEEEAEGEVEQEKDEAAVAAKAEKDDTDTKAAATDTAKGGNDGETEQEAAAKATTEEEDDATDEVERPSVPPYVPPAVENYDSQINAIKEERKALLTKFKDGEIDLDVMLEKRDELDEKRAALRDQQRAHELLRDQSEHDAKRTWEIEVAHFQRAHQEYGLDKDGKPVDPVMFNALDGLVKQLAADLANVDKPAHWFLDEAHALIAAKMQPPKPTAKEQTPKEGGDKTVVKSRKPDLSVVPKTLADIPAAESERPATDEFANLDKLSGMELEQAVARLTPDQQARYANG